MRKRKNLIILIHNIQNLYSQKGCNFIKIINKFKLKLHLQKIIKIKFQIMNNHHRRMMSIKMILMRIIEILIFRIKRFKMKRLMLKKM